MHEIRTDFTFIDFSGHSSLPTRASDIRNVLSAHSWTVVLVTSAAVELKAKQSRK